MTRDLLIKLIKRWEGGEGSLGRDTNDAAAKYPCPTPYKGKTGWHTSEGVTYKTWVGKFGRNNDARFFEMNNDDWFAIFRERFFDKVGGTKYSSMNVAAVVVDMSFMSGAYEAIETLQEAINDVKGPGTVAVDGTLFRKDGSSRTIDAANTIDPLTLIKAMVVRRKRFFTQITDGNTPQELKNRKFLNGWINRTNDYLNKATYLNGL